MIKSIHEYLNVRFIYQDAYESIYFVNFHNHHFWIRIQIQVPIFLQGLIRNREHMGVGSETEVRFR